MSNKARTQYLSINTHMAQCLAAHFRGSPESWRDVSADVDTLIRGEEALLPRVYRTPHFHPMEGNEFMEQQPLVPLAQWLEDYPPGQDEGWVVATGEYLLRLLVRNYLLSDPKNLLLLGKEGYARDGRGALLTGLSQVAENYNGKLETFYVPAAKLFEHFEVEPGQQRDALQAQFDAYDPQKEVLVWSQNIGGSLSHFKVA